MASVVLSPESILISGKLFELVDWLISSMENHRKSFNQFIIAQLFRMNLYPTGLGQKIFERVIELSFC